MVFTQIAILADFLDGRTGGTAMNRNSAAERQLDVEHQAVMHPLKDVVPKSY
jgi:hypothetical protein